MTFTEADHAKAVELYKTYKDADWWPVFVYDHDKGWTNWGDRVRDSVALSAIAWAMVERLGDTDHWLDMDTGLWHVGFDESNQGHTTRFLALAAAVEALDKGG